MEQKTRMLIIKIKDCKVPVKGGKLAALAGRYFIFKYCVSSWWLLLFFVIVSRAIFVLYCSLVVILMFVLLYLDLGLLFVLCLGAILNNSFLTFAMLTPLIILANSADGIFSIFTQV